MKLVLMVFGLMMILTFGAITAVDSYTASAIGAAGDDDDVSECRDDGDDGAENPDLPDNPDSEENGEDTDGGEIGDTEENPTEPYEEWDDNCRKGPEPTGVLGETGTPTATPCPLGVSAQGPGDCFCQIYPFACCDSAGGDPEAALICCFGSVSEVGGQLICCFSAGGGEINAEGPFCDVSAADANCDGAVTVADVLATLTAVGGGEAAAEGCASGGDADCSGSVDALDTLAILKILAGISEPAAC